MPIRLSAIFAVLTVVFSIALDPLFFSGGHWLSHGVPPSVTGVFPALSMAEGVADTHGHFHEDDTDGLGGEQAPQHSHGHNPADHSHPVPLLPTAGLSFPRDAGPRWLLSPGQAVVSEAGPRPERPPRG